MCIRDRFEFRGTRRPLLSRGGVAARSRKVATATSAAQTGWCWSRNPGPTPPRPLHQRSLRIPLLRCGVRFHSHQRAVVLCSEQIEEAVGPLAYISNTILQFPQHSFAMEFFPLVVEIDSLEVS